ncbi:MAG: hypothetical protein KDC24_06880 [Saprospiraceae bacterium]|nr:hypothetical protein [Saprospiraceae bacterium]
MKTFTSLLLFLFFLCIQYSSVYGQLRFEDLGGTEKGDAPAQNRLLTDINGEVVCMVLGTFESGNPGCMFSGFEVKEFSSPFLSAICANKNARLIAGLKPVNFTNWESPEALLNARCVLQLWSFDGDVIFESKPIVQGGTLSIEMDDLGRTLVTGDQIGGDSTIIYLFKPTGEEAFNFKLPKANYWHKTSFSFTQDTSKFIFIRKGSAPHEDNKSSGSILLFTAEGLIDAEKVSGPILGVFASRGDTIIKVGLNNIELYRLNKRNKIKKMDTINISPKILSFLPFENGIYLVTENGDFSKFEFGPNLKLEKLFSFDKKLSPFRFSIGKKGNAIWVKSSKAFGRIIL